MGELPTRKVPVHGILSRPGQPTIIYDTVCTKGRLPWLASDKVHFLLRQIWAQADSWKVGRYVIMPDHIHLFVAETEQTIPYENWVRYWKSQLTRQNGAADQRWQSHHWETRLRTRDQMEEKWNYILANPVRAGLVERFQDWPYQGEIFTYSWD